MTCAPMITPMSCSPRPSPVPVLPHPGHDFGSLRYAVKMARPTPERADLNAALALAVRELAASRAPRKTLILAGDFQRTNWQDIALDTLPASRTTRSPARRKCRAFSRRRS